MVQKATMKFLKDLKANNNKPWFDEHKEEYNTAKADFEALTGSFLSSLAKLEPELANQSAKNCVFRIYRDVRFAKDKTPYKDHFGSYFSKGGRKWPGAGFYLQVTPGNSFAAGGIWMPEPPLLKSIRQEIDYNFDEFQQILNNKNFKKYFSRLEGEQLKTLPQGYTADNPAAEYLKMKSFVVTYKFGDKEATSPDFVKQATDVFTAMKPLVDFLNRALD